MSKRLPAGCCGLYVATNVPGGVRSDWLAPLCDASLGGFNCSDQATLGVASSNAWRALLRESGLSASTAALLLDQAIGASAERGFFSTSKFCGPAGFRRSTFSEGIALRWQQRRRGAQAPPLCAHALERALLQGRAARGEHVY